MKRGILVLLFILLLACSVNAITVTFGAASPANGRTFTDDDFPIYFSCNANWDEENQDNLSSLSVVWWWEYDGFNEFAEIEYRPDVEDGVDETFNLPVPPYDPPHPAITYEWNCRAISNESVEYWADTGSNRTFTLAESSVPNTAPSCTVADNTNITVNEDSGSWALDSNMSQAVNVSCQDGDTPPDALNYSITQTGSGGTFSLSSNDILNFATDANATGTKVAVIKVSDGTSANDIYVSAQVIITAVNDPPLASTIPNQNWNQNANKTIDLGDYFSDVDDTSFNYSYAFNSSSSHISAVIQDDNAVLTPETNWYGSETITFTAYDSANLSFTSNEVTLTVQQANTTANNPPSIDTITPTTDPTISVGGSQTFSITKSDPDSDSMNVTWYVDGVSQEGETSDSFTYTASIVGSFVIKVAISDGKASDTNSWALTVKSAQAANQTAPPADKKTGENVTACGDTKCLGDEDQLNCCKDCGCPEGYNCNADTNKCTKKKTASNIILVAVVLGLFAGGAGVGLYIYKKKQEQEIFGGLANTPFSLPPKEGEVKGEELIVKKPQEPVKKAEKAQEKPLKDTKTTSQVLLKNFIITNLKKGKTLDQIKEELHKVGWTDEQINDAYTAAQLDEAFS